MKRSFMQSSVGPYVIKLRRLISHNSLFNQFLLFTVLPLNYECLDKRCGLPPLTSHLSEIYTSWGENRTPNRVPNPFITFQSKRNYCTVTPYMGMVRVQVKTLDNTAPKRPQA